MPFSSSISTEDETETGEEERDFLKQRNKEAHSNDELEAEKEKERRHLIKERDLLALWEETQVLFEQICFVVFRPDGKLPEWTAVHPEEGKH